MYPNKISKQYEQINFKIMFTEVSKLLHEGETLFINIRKTGDQLVVIVLPQSENVKDPAKDNLIPLNLKGSPEELDEKFIAVISEPVLKATTLMTNMGEYEKAAEKAAQESKAIKDKQELISNKLKEIETLEKDKKYAQALAVCRTTLELDPANVKIKLKFNFLQQKTGSNDLFSSVSTATPAATPVEQSDELDNPNDENDLPDEENYSE
jgi:PRTRC genetic system protein E